MIAQLGKRPPCKRAITGSSGRPFPPIPSRDPNQDQSRELMWLSGVPRFDPMLRRATMCDYSLHAIASRPAKVGEKLVTTCFAGTSTRGFAAVDEPQVAVCLLPGTEVVFEQEAEYEHAFGRLIPGLRLGKLGHNVARFRQINSEQAHVHHDALEFPNGRIL